MDGVGKALGKRTEQLRREREATDLGMEAMALEMEESVRQHRARMRQLDEEREVVKRRNVTARDAQEKSDRDCMIAGVVVLIGMMVYLYFFGRGGQPLSNS